MMPPNRNIKDSLFGALHRAEEPPAESAPPRKEERPRPEAPVRGPAPQAEPPGWEARVADLEKRLAEAQRLSIEATVRLNERDEAQKNAIRETEKLLEAVSASRRNEDRDQRAFTIASEHERRLTELESRLRESQENARRAAISHEPGVEPLAAAMAASCARVDALAAKAEESFAKLRAMDERLNEASRVSKEALEAARSASAEAVKAAVVYDLAAETARREMSAEAERSLLRMRANMEAEREGPALKARELTEALVMQYAALREKVDGEAGARHKEIENLRRLIASAQPPSLPPAVPDADAKNNASRLDQILDRKTDDLGRKLDDSAGP